MQLTDRLIQIEQLAAHLQNEAVKIRKELEKGEKKKRKNEELDKLGAAIIADKYKHFKVIKKP